LWPAKGARRARVCAPPAARPLAMARMSPGASKALEAETVQAHPEHEPQRRFCPPPDPHQYRPEPAPCLFCLMDKKALRLDMMDKLRLPTWPRLRRFLAHRGPPSGPDALRLPGACGAL
jgi:hypothetical protein